VQTRFFRLRGRRTRLHRRSNGMSPSVMPAFGVWPFPCSNALGTSAPGSSKKVLKKAVD
jgi:hypothetical protein